MKVFNRILCPTDFQEGSLSALDLAHRLAVQNDAELDVLHVRSAIAVAARRGIATEVESEDSARQKIEEIATQRLANSRYNLIVTEGDVPVRVTGSRATLGDDLIVMGTHGRRGTTHFFLGSVAERVIRESDCPVLTTRVTLASEEAPNVFHRILCALDFEQSSLKGLDLAIRLAAQNDAMLYLLHVCPTVAIPLGGSVTEPVTAPEESKRKMAEIEQQRLRDIRHETLIVNGDPAERVKGYQSSLDIDLIVMGTHGRRGVSHFLLGSVAERIVKEAACPVITIRQG